MTEVMVTTGAIRRAKLQSNRHRQQTNTQLFTGRMSLLSPNQQCQSTEGINFEKGWQETIMGLDIRTHTHNGVYRVPDY